MLPLQRDHIFGKTNIVHFKQVPLSYVRELLKKGNIISAVGHQATADLLSSLLGMKIPMQRRMIKIKKEQDVIIVFSLTKRLSEGKIISSEEEIKTMGYKFVEVRLLPNSLLFDY